MKKGNPITAFYVETLLLILVFIGIILALTQVFGLSRNESVQAKLLTNAVTLAQNAADEVLAGEAVSGESERNFYEDMTPCEDRGYRLTVRTVWREEDGLRQGTVTVLDSHRSEPIYTLPICRYVGEAIP